jgi:hypothetical protein
VTIEIRPCHYVGSNLTPCAESAAEFFSMYRRNTKQPQQEFHLDNFPTRQAAQAALDYELRCQAYEAEGLDRSDAQASVDTELLHSHMRATAHLLPQRLADAGYRIEYGDENCNELLMGQWWWTFTRGGYIEASDVQYVSAEAAVAGAARDHGGA